MRCKDFLIGVWECWVFWEVMMFSLVLKDRLVKKWLVGKDNYVVELKMLVLFGILESSCFLRVNCFGFFGL